MHQCKCLVCGKEFESKIGASYCSKACYKKYRAGQVRQMTASLKMERKRLSGETQKKKKGPYDWLDAINEEIRKNGGTYIKKQ